MRYSLGALALVAVGLVPATLSAATPSPACQRAIARASAKFVKASLERSQHCAMRAGSGAACRVAAGRPTGDRRTDSAIARASRRLGRDVADACARSDLSAFARRCPDPTGARLTLAELVTCLRDTHLERVGAMVAVEFPTHTPRPAAVDCPGGQSCQCSCVGSPSGAFLTPAGTGLL
jgi:hypothetical protein